MAINHDLTYFADYLVSTDNLYDHVVFLDLGNRLETFDKDAEFLEREYKVVISRIHPRDCLEATVSACRIPIKEGLELIHRLIADGHKVAVAERLLTPRAADFGRTYSAEKRKYEWN